MATYLKISDDQGTYFKKLTWCPFSKLGAELSISLIKLSEDSNIHRRFDFIP